MELWLVSCGRSLDPSRANFRRGKQCFLTMDFDPRLKMVFGIRRQRLLGGRWNKINKRRVDH